MTVASPHLQAPQRRWLFYVSVGVILPGVICLHFPAAAATEPAKAPDALRAPHVESNAPVTRPSLLVNEQDIKTLRERVRRDPYRTCYEHYRQLMQRDAGVSSNADMQMSTLVFLVEQDPAYAKRATDLLMGWLRDWETVVPQVKGEDQRSLSISRDVRNASLIYSILQPCGAFTDKQKEFAQRVLTMCALRMMERGQSFNPYDYFDPHFRVSNWNSDRFVAVGMVALAFPEHDSADAWLRHALHEFDWQMENVVTAEGAWPEGTRYHGAVMRAMVPFAFAVQNREVANLFANEKFKRMFESLVRTQGPRDATFERRALTPGTFDGNWENLWSCLLAWGATAYRQTDPEFAGRLTWAWHRAGSPFPMEMSPGNPICSFLFTDSEIQPMIQAPLTSEVLPIGYAIFRSGFDTDHESFLLFNIATERGLWHQHFDRGSFSLYGFNTPLTLDPGVQAYSERHIWFQRGKAHNLVQFNEEDNRGNGRIAHHLFDPQLDYVDADLTQAVGYAYHRRIFFIRPHCYLVWDDINTTAPARYHLHVMTESLPPSSHKQSVHSTDSAVLFHCANQIDLQCDVLWPANVFDGKLANVTDDVSPVTFYGAPTTISKYIERVTTPKWLTIDQRKAGEDFVTLLYPKRREAGRLRAVVAAGPTVKNAVRDRYEIDVEGDDWSARLFLGSSTAGKQPLLGDAGVVLFKQPSVQRTTYLINGTRLEADDDHLIQVDFPTTIVLREKGDGQHFDLSCLGRRFGKLTLKLPWNAELGAVHVLADDDVRPVAFRRVTESGTIQFTLDEKNYRIVIHK